VGDSGVSVGGLGVSRRSVGAGVRLTLIVGVREGVIVTVGVNVSSQIHGSVLSVGVGVAVGKQGLGVSCSFT